MCLFNLDILVQDILVLCTTQQLFILPTPSNLYPRRYNQCTFYIGLMGRTKERLRRQFQLLLKNEYSPKVKASLIDDDIFHWKAYIQSPQQCPYQGGLFELQIILPQQYPQSAPKMKFLTDIWHPNISSITGAIYIDILIDQWTPALTIQKVLVSLQGLLGQPQHDDTCNQAVALEYNIAPKIFEQHARRWVKKYATQKVLTNGEVISNIQIAQELFQQQYEKEIEIEPLAKIDRIMLNKYMTYLKSILPS